VIETGHGTVVQRIPDCHDDCGKTLSDYNTIGTMSDDLTKAWLARKI